MTNNAFRELLDLLMVYDTINPAQIPTSALVALADDESNRRGFESWVVAYNEFTAEEATQPGPMTRVPGIAAMTAIISSDCRRNRGDYQAIDEALRRLRAEMATILSRWPLEKEATFFVCFTVDRNGRKGLF